MPWVKAFHIIAVVCWFAALFYLPRLFVYHCQALAENDRIGSERFKTMERKLYRGIMTPSMMVALVLGIWMLIDRWNSYFKNADWMYIKLALVVILIAYHHVCGAYLKKFATEKNTRSERFYRIFNEVPVFILIAIILLVTLKQPF